MVGNGGSFRVTDYKASGKGEKKLKKRPEYQNNLNSFIPRYPM
jgi:hypothetical protein